MAEHRAHTARDVETNAAGGNDAALVRVESCHAADRKSISPMRVGHHIGRLDDSGERGDVGGLLIDLIVHITDEGFVREDDTRHPHRASWLDPPGRRVNSGETSRVHDLDVDDASCRPCAVGFLRYAQRCIRRALRLAGGSVLRLIDWLSP